MDSHAGIGMVRARGHECPVTAHRLADLFGVGDVRERKPQSGRRDADQNLAHFLSPPLHTCCEIRQKPFGSGFAAGNR
jgi:hypothetical protein